MVAPIGQVELDPGNDDGGNYDNNSLHSVANAQCQWRNLI